ncbi:MAG: dUTP diphosphatase [Candidatus Fimenecus sp.]
MDILKIKKLTETALVPTRATEGSAGLDLCADIEKSVVLKNGDTAVISTGIAIEIPKGYAAYIFARSGLSIKHGITLLNAVGVIDSDYRGEIKVGVINLKKDTYEIKQGERIAQLVIMPVSLMPIKEVQYLSDTERGSGGFGSTGKI